MTSEIYKNWRVEGKFCQFRVSSFISVPPRYLRLRDFVRKNTDLFYISCSNLELTAYLEVKLCQRLFKHINIIPTKYNKTYNMKNEENAAMFP